MARVQKAGPVTDETALSRSVGLRLQLICRLLPPTAHHHTAVRALAFKWQRILWSC